MLPARERKKLFLAIFKKAEKKYGPSRKRLAADSWPQAWQLLVATILSAQSRDETTIPIAEKLFETYPTLQKLASASVPEVLSVIQSINYNATKANHILAAARMVLEQFHGTVPQSMDELLRLPGVGRKTANIIRSEWHQKDAIVVDTHVHRISNVLGLVQTKTPEQTEKELGKIVPKQQWSRVNRLFVLWGKEVPGRDKKRLLRALED